MPGGKDHTSFRPERPKWTRSGEIYLKQISRLACGSLEMTVNCISCKVY